MNEQHFQWLDSFEEELIGNRIQNSLQKSFPDLDIDFFFPEERFVYERRVYEDEIKREIARQPRILVKQNPLPVVTLEKQGQQQKQKLNNKLEQRTTSYTFIEHIKMSICIFIGFFK